MMRIERHYDDEVLISLLDDPSAEAAARDQHLGLCAPCSDLLDSYRAISECLGVAAVWDLREMKAEEPVPSTIATLRAFADQMDREDAAAARFVAQLLAGPRESWMPRLATHPEWRTAGVVRKLIAATDHALDTMPPDAVEITALATEIADKLDAKQYASDTVLKLRGAAWRERAFALEYTGDFRPALAAADRSEAMFMQATVSAFDLGRLFLVRARVLRNFNREVEALSATRQAHQFFVDAGDQKRADYARLTEGIILYSLHQYRDALAIFEAGDYSHEPRTAAMMLNNIAVCHRELRNFRQAAAAYERAMRAFDMLGMETDAIRARWSIGKMFVGEGRIDEAASRFRLLRLELQRKGMSGEYFLATLDLAESLLLKGDTQEAAALCRELIQRLDTETSIAHTALALLREAAVAEPAVAAKKVVEVRKQVRSAPRRENLLFAAAPDF